MSSSKDLFLDYMAAEATVDAIIELHYLESVSEPEYLRAGYCAECSFPEMEVYVMYPCNTIKIARNK